MKFIAPEWVQGLARSLEHKYKAEVGNTNMLDLMVEFWMDDCTDSVEFFGDIGATTLEIKAWLYNQGDDTYENDLVEEFQAIVA